MKIALAAGFAPSLIGFRGQLVQTLISDGHAVFTSAAEEDQATAETLRSWGVGYQALPLQRAGINPLSDRRYFRALRIWLEATDADVVLAYTHKPVVYAALAAGALPKRLEVYPLISGLGYAFIGDGLKAQTARCVMTALYRRASRHFSGVFFQNPDDQTLFRALKLIQAHTPQCIVRGSGIDLSGFPRMPVFTEAMKPDRLRFLLIARLLGDKGIREYAAAALRIKRDYPGAEFHLVGSTDPNPAAISLAEVETWQREGVIIYHGAQQDIRPFMQNCSVYVLPSYREGTPRTVLEAMATGRAVITTDAPGCRETVFDVGPSNAAEIRTGQNGLLVPVKSVDALETAMRHFIEKPELVLRMGEAGRRLAEEHYDVHKVNRQMLEFMGLSANPVGAGGSGAAS